jgi:hypothetical protein
LFHFFLLFCTLELRWRGRHLTLESAKSGKVGKVYGRLGELLNMKSSWICETVVKTGTTVFWTRFSQKVFEKYQVAPCLFLKEFCVHQEEGTTFCCLFKIFGNSKDFDVQQLKTLLSDIIKHLTCAPSQLTDFGLEFLKHSTLRMGGEFWRDSPPFRI